MPISDAGMIGAQTGSDLLTTFANYFLNRNTQREAFRENRAQSELAYQRDLDMWNRQSTWNRQMWDLQNEYNLPTNQMNRLRAAGLNPNLIYGNGAAGGQATAIQKAEMPKYQAARANYQARPLQVPNVIGMYQDVRMRNAQIDNVKEQANLARERILTESAMRADRVKGQAADLARKMVLARYASEFARLDAQNKQQLLENRRVDAAYRRAQTPGAEAGSQLKKEELKWMKDYGMRPGDPLQYRWLMRLFEQVFGTEAGTLFGGR